MFSVICKVGEISQKEECVIVWSIKDFLSLSDRYYRSPTFSFGNESWSLRISPNETRRNDAQSFTAVDLSRAFDGPPITMEFTLGIKTADEKLDFERHLRHTFDSPYFGRCVPEWISRSELLRRKSDLLPSGTLTLVCRMERPESAELSSLSSTVATKCSYCNVTLGAQEDIQCHLRRCEDLPINCPKCSDDVALKNWFDHKCQMTDEDGVCSALTSSVDLPKNKILQDFKQLFLTKENCDIIFKVKDQEIHAHKAILSARSPVLASTFRYDMKEKASGIVTIEDFDPRTFGDFLCFLYCEDVDLSESNVFSLFTAADKYDVADLKEKCMGFIKANLSVDTFCDTIALAVLHADTQLISLATDVFVKNADKIIETVQWQSFLADNPTCCNELFIKLLASNKK